MNLLKPGGKVTSIQITNQSLDQANTYRPSNNGRDNRQIPYGKKTAPEGAV